MKSISPADIKRRIQRDNPWWDSASALIPEANYPFRVYYHSFESIALNFDVRRAAILLGPRRVGKTVILKQLVHSAIGNGIDPRAIFYASVDAPIFSGIPLEKYIDFMPKLPDDAHRLVIFDEIQYLPQWETHLKDLVDNYPQIKFIASGSAAAALRLKSKESGAGRFTEFMLPPLTFYEYVHFTNQNEHLIYTIEKTIINDATKQDRTYYDYQAKDINKLNEVFIEYLNYGGYPEAVLNEQVRKNAEQFIKNDIIDKVLLKDLPSLYGISDIPGLNKLFSFLAYNTGNEASLENISKESGLTKPTIKKFIEYLENAFLIIKLPTVDDNCRTLQRERNFKIYLNNPSMRAALFAPVRFDDSTQIGHLSEAAIFSQWQHAPNFRQLRYARWRNQGEVDIVYLRSSDDKPYWIGEIKWSDKIVNDEKRQAKSMDFFLRKHGDTRAAFFTTKTWSGKFRVAHLEVYAMPSSLYCYTVGRNITSRLDEIVDRFAP